MTPTQGEHAQTEALYAAAMEFAAEKASISYVQRKCRCSYNDAERMLERMVSDGIIETYGGRKTVATTPAQPAPQGVAYAELPAGSAWCGAADVRDFGTGPGESALMFAPTRTQNIPLFTADQMHYFADATHALRASNGQAPAVENEMRRKRLLAEDIAWLEMFAPNTRERAHIISVLRGQGTQAAPAADALSVTNILIDIVPGLDGMGHEVYAKSVKDVEDKLSAMDQELEDWQLGIRKHAPAAGAVAGPTDATRNAWQQGYAQGVASALPSKVTPDMRRVFREGYREGGFWSDRLDYALEKMLAAAPTPAAQADSVLEDAARWKWVAAHWKTVNFRFDKRGGLLAGFTLTVEATKTGDGAAAIEREIDAARKQGGKHDNH